MNRQIVDLCNHKIGLEFNNIEDAIHFCNLYSEYSNRIFDTTFVAGQILKHGCIFSKDGLSVLLSDKSLIFEVYSRNNYVVELI